MAVSGLLAEIRGAAVGGYGNNAQHNKTQQYNNNRQWRWVYYYIVVGGARYIMYIPTQVDHDSGILLLLSLYMLSAGKFSAAGKRRRRRRRRRYISCGPLVKELPPTG